MELNTKCRQETFPSHNCFLKAEIDEEDKCQSKGFLHEFQHLDHLTLVGSSFNPDLGIQTTGFDSFDPFSNGSFSMGFEFSDFRPFEEIEAYGNNPDTQKHVNVDVEGGGGNIIGNLLNFKASKVAPLLMDDDGNSSESHNNLISSCLGNIKKRINFSVADETSCITADNGYFKERGLGRNNRISNNNNSSFCSARRAGGRGRKKVKSAKGQWTVEEDRLLVHLVEKFGLRKWSHIAQMLKGRIGKQCRERWHNHLRPDIKKDVWTEEEDRILIEAHAEIGNKWAEIAKRLAGRTENSIKNHWNATKRRQFSRRKCRTKWAKPSNLLQNYIESLNLEKAEGSSSSSSGNSRRRSNAFSRNCSSRVHKQKTMELCNEQLVVPFYEFDEVPEFVLDDKLFEDNVGIGHCLPIPEEKGFDHMEMEMDMGIEIINPYGMIPTFSTHFDEKKELDLMEMTTHIDL